jgi:hypothetical protein
MPPACPGDGYARCYTYLHFVAANVKLPRTSRGHRRHKPALLALRKVTIKDCLLHQTVPLGAISDYNRPMQLIINTFGTSLRRKGERLIIKSPASPRPVEISAHKVQSLVIATGVHLSSNVVHLASEHNIDIVFLDKSGHPTARVWQTKMGSTAAIRRRQLEAAETDEALGIVRGWIAKKINNQLEFLRELEHRRPDSKDAFASPLGTLAQCAEKVAACTGTVDEQRSTLMGLEGAAGRAYFTCLGQLVPEEYRFTGRSRQPAVDPFNAMLNYSYGVLYSLVERALILAGPGSLRRLSAHGQLQQTIAGVRHDRAVSHPGRPDHVVDLHRPPRETRILPRDTGRDRIESRGPPRADGIVQQAARPHHPLSRAAILV